MPKKVSFVASDAANSVDSRILLKEQAMKKVSITTDDTEEQVLFLDVSDETLEKVATGMGGCSPTTVAPMRSTCVTAQILTA
jgi:hypothetical protein